MAPNGFLFPIQNLQVHSDKKFIELNPTCVGPSNIQYPATLDSTLKSANPRLWWKDIFNILYNNLNLIAFFDDLHRMHIQNHFPEFKDWCKHLLSLLGNPSRYPEQVLLAPIMERMIAHVTLHPILITQISKRKIHPQSISTPARTWLAQYDFTLYKELFDE